MVRSRVYVPDPLVSAVGGGLLLAQGGARADPALAARVHHDPSAQRLGYRVPAAQSLLRLAFERDSVEDWSAALRTPPRRAIRCESRT